MNKLLIKVWSRLPVTRRMRNLLMWLLNAKFSVGVVGLVMDAEGRVLLLKHTYRGQRPWGLPGGSLQSGETLEGCLRRELREETGMRVEVGSLLAQVAHQDRRLLDTIFACQPCAGESLAGFTPNAEIAQAAYFHPDSFPDGMSASQLRLIRAALDENERRGLAGLK